MDLIADPPNGVGTLNLGMALDQADAALKAMPGYLGAASTPMFAQFDSGMSIAIEVGANGVKSVEIYRPEQDADVRIMFRGIPVFDDPAEQVIERLAAQVSLDIEEEGRRAVAPNLLLSLWRDTLPDSPEDEDGRSFQSILIARPGYYTTYE